MSPSTGGVSLTSDGDVFRHEAVLYNGPEDFVDRMTAFISARLDVDDHVLVMVTADKIDLLRSALGPEAPRVGFRDMAQVGLNPSRIIPAWRDFFTETAGTGRRVRGIGEPIWSTRSPQELRESQRHEELINLAFTGMPGTILCPYDVTSLDDSVIEEAHASHPIMINGRPDDSPYRGAGAIARPFDDPLPEPSSTELEIDFDFGSLQSIRYFVEGGATSFGLDHQNALEFVLAVSELAANTVRHGGGDGHMRLWFEADAMVCEIRDRGQISEPLVGRTRPDTGKNGGLGLWIVNQLCDLVQVRTSPSGTVVRVRKYRS